MNFLEGAAGTTTKVFTDAQLTSVKSSLTASVNTIIDTFIDLLPIIALITGAIFGIKFVKNKFNTVGRTKA